MTILPLVTKSLVIAGTVILLLAFMPLRRVIRELPPGNILNRWYVQTAMMVIFIIAYLCYLIAFWDRSVVFSDLIVPVVFMLGSLFVWQTARVSQQTAIDVKRITFLEHENIIDALTGVYNRRYIERRLREELARARRFETPLSVLLLDIDHFKQVNDTYGHQAGDLVLAQVGNLMHQSVREADIVARYGGEEFLIIAPNTAAFNATAIASRLLTGIGSHEFTVPDSRGRRQVVRITVSIGLTDVGSGDDEVIKCVSRADEALYQAKHEGRNRFVVRHIAREIYRERGVRGTDQDVLGI